MFIAVQVFQSFKQSSSTNIAYATLSMH